MQIPRRGRACALCGGPECAKVTGMSNAVPEALAIIAGKGAYPRVLAQSARAQGIRRLAVLAFRGETDPVIETLADEVRWIHVGQLGAFFDALQGFGIRDAVMAGQITPSNLFRVRMDGPMLKLLARLPVRNAETIFGAAGEELRARGIELRPASLFMEGAMPPPGRLGARAPTEAEQADIALGFRVAKTTSGLDIGQTVVLKAGTILAVEAFEGTDEAIRRGGELGGPGVVVVKTAKASHDMRFDIPVVGEHTLRVLRRVKAAALAVEAGRTILLDRGALVAAADEIGLAFVAVDTGRAAAGGRAGPP
jgi:UDP-2,3-diacylglucosamine hydrolase